jgi:hypothetical protein
MARDYGERRHVDTDDDSLRGLRDARRRGKQ